MSQSYFFIFFIFLAAETSDPQGNRKCSGFEGQDVMKIFLFLFFFFFFSFSSNLHSGSDILQKAGRRCVGEMRRDMLGPGCCQDEHN